MHARCRSTKLTSLICLLVVGGCGPKEPRIPAGESLQAVQQSFWRGEPAPTAAELQAFPLADYRAYPDGLRPLLQKREIEYERCLAVRGWRPEVALPSCNRRYAIDLALERLGWCVGRPRVGTRTPFLRCAEDPRYRSGELEAEGPPFRRDEIDWWVRSRQAQDAGQPIPRPVPRRARPTQAALSALQAPVAAEALRRDPLSAFRDFPLAIRPWLQRAQMEDRRCEAGTGDIDPERLRACNRRYHLLVELERLGWCMPGPRRWVRCSELPYTPGRYELQGPTYRQSYIDWATRYRNSHPPRDGEHPSTDG